MIDINEILGHYGILLTEKLKDAIVNKPVTKYGAVNASGELERSITYTIEGSTLTIWGNDYIYYLQNGRGPNKNQSKEALLNFAGWAGSTFIKDWINDKGLDLNPFAVAYNLGKNGNIIYQQGGSNLVSSIFDEALQQTIENEFAGLLASEIESEILQIAE